MRKALLTVPLFAVLAVPAQAQTADEGLWDDDPYAEADETVLAVDRVMDAVLDLPVGRLAGAVPEADLARDIRPGDTLRSLGTREDPAFEERMRGGARAMAGMATQMIGRLSEMMPELEAMGERIGDALPEDRRR
ncbi:MAG: hypothetical protein ABR601_06820 [Parasphingopyxis sp.]|nr:hypothetical protein [Sphingomonadales bacterium]